MASGSFTEPALDTQVTVVGAGPVGLLLAGELRLGGADVVVLEQRETPIEESRASTLHARTMEILDSRGLLARFGELPGQPRGHFGGIPLDLSLPGTPYPGQWKVEQPRTEELLQQWATELGARVLRGRTVCSLTDHGDHVVTEVEGPEGPERFSSAYVVGCDGEDSTVRRLAGIGLRGTAAAHELIRADVDGIRVRDRRFERLAGGLAIAARRPDGVTRVMVHAYGSPPRERGGKAPEFAEVAEVWRAVTGEDISGGTPLWTNAFGDVNLQAESYRAGRVLLAGDAAHQQLPAGGQALNLGLQDAFNLGWKLALTVRGSAPDSLLDTYHDERHPAGRRTLANIRTQAMLLLGGPETDGPRSVMTELIEQEPGVRRRFAGMISGLGVAYPPDDAGTGGGAGSSGGAGTGREGGSGQTLVGAPLPYLLLSTHSGPPTDDSADDGARTSSASLLRDGRGLLLTLATGEPAVAAAAVAGPWADRVTQFTAVSEGAPAPGGPAESPQPALDGGVFLVRPDGHLAWVSPDGGGTDGLTGALRQWFGPPGSP